MQAYGESGDIAFARRIARPDAERGVPSLEGSGDLKLALRLGLPGVRHATLLLLALLTSGVPGFFSIVSSFSSANGLGRAWLGQKLRRILLNLH